MACTADEVKAILGSISEKYKKDLLKDAAKNPVRFDTWAITPALISKLFNNTEAAAKSALKEVKKIVNSPSFMRKLDGISKLAEETPNIMYADNPSPETIVKRGIAFNHIMGSLKSERDLAEKHSLSEDEINQVTNPSNGVHNVGALGLYAAIGRDIAYDLGVKITSGSPEFVNSQYAKIGNAAIKDLENIGIIETGEGKIINRNFKKENGKNFARRQRLINGSFITVNFESMLPDMKEDMYDDSFMDYIYREPNSTDLDYKYDGLVNPVDMAKFVYRLKVPSNLKLPHLDEDLMEVKNSINTTKRRQKVVDALDGTVIRVNEVFDDVIIEMDKFMNGETYDSTLDSFVTEPVIREFIWGTKQDEDTPYDLKASDRGRSLSQSTSVEDAVENSSTLLGQDLHFRNFVARNDRNHIYQSVLNAQSDKFFSRSVLVGKNYDIDIGKMPKIFTHLVNDINDVSGIDTDAIMNPGHDTGLDSLIKDYNKNFIHGSKNRKLAFMVHLTKAKRGKPGLSASMVDFVSSNSSIWQVLKVLDGINDIRNRQDGKFTTNYMTAPDATASGAIISFMQMTGKNANVDQILEDMGFYGKGEIKLKDVYAILSNRFEDMLNKGVDELNDLENQFPEEISKVFEMGVFGSIDKRNRELSKPLTMTFVYGQSTGGAKATVGKQIAKSVLERAQESDLDYLKDILRPAFKNIDDVKTIKELKAKRGILPVLTTHYGNTVVGPLQTVLKEEVEDKLLKDNLKFVEEVYADMEAAAKDNNERVKIVPPNAYVDFLVQKQAKHGRDYKITKSDYKYLLKKHGAPLMSIYETITDSGTLIQKEFANATTARVNINHMMDSAIYLEAHRRTIAQFKKEYPGEELPGNIGIHDANMNNPIYNEMYQTHYRQSAVWMNSVYDFNENLVSSLEAMGADQAVVKKHRDEIAGQEDAKKAKLKKFDDKSTNLFGHSNELEIPKKKVNKQGNEPKTPKPNKQPEVETETENKSEPEESIPEPTAEEKDWITYSEMLQEILSTGKISAASINKRFVQDRSSVPEYVKNFFANPSIRDILVQAKENYYSPVTDKIGVVPGKTTEEQLNHEITHFMTSYYMLSSKYKGYNAIEKRYISSSMENLAKVDMSTLDAKQKKAFKRIGYALNHEDKQIGMAEFVAIMASEEDVSEAIYNYLDENTSKERRFKFGEELKSFIDKIMNRIVHVFKPTMMDIRLIEKDGVNPQVLASSISNIIYNGSEARKDNAGVEAFKKEYEKEFKKPLGFEPGMPTNNYQPATDQLTDPFSTMTHAMNDYTRRVIESHIIPITSVAALTGFTAANKFMKHNFPMYQDTADYVYKTWDENTFIGQMKHYLNADNFKGYADKNRFLSMMLNAMQRRAKVDNTLVREIDALMEPLSDTMKDRVDYAYSKSSLFNLDTRDMDRILKSNDFEGVKLDAEKSATSKEKKIAMDMANMFVLGEAHNDNYAYNVESMGLSENAKKRVKRLIALYSIEIAPSGLKTIQTVFKDHPVLHNRLIDASTALNTMNEVVYKGSGDNRNYRGNIANDVFEVPKVFQVVSMNDVKYNRYKAEDGWKTLRKAESGIYGIVYKDIREQSFQEGAGVNVDYIHDDIVAFDSDPSYSLKLNNAVRVSVGSTTKHKLILTDAEKKSLGVVRSPAKSLVRSYANLQMIADTQAIRDELLTKKYKFDINTNIDEKNLVDMIKNNRKDGDYPWVVDFDEDKFVYEDLDPEIKKRYKIKDSTHSGIHGFRTNIKLIRTDLAPWLEGYKEPVLFEHSPMLKTTAYTIKQLVKLTKIHWIITNPVKIANDMVSNTLILTAKNVSALKMLKYGKEAASEIKELEDLRSQALRLRVDMMAGKPGAEAAMKRVEKKIQDHPISFALYHGMIQSLSTDIVLKDYDTVSGLQRDMENVFNILVKGKNKKELNGFGKLLSKFASWGVGSEDALNFISNAVGKVKVGENFSDITAEMSKNISNIKKDEDMAKYLSQFVAGPDSEAARLGSAATQIADLIPRIILFKDNIDNGMTEDDAVKESLESFIDYKVNMPKEIKILSDYGILMFPSFWLRIQKVILGLAKNSSASVLGALSLQELTGLHLSNVLESNILRKWSNDQIFNTPEFELLPTDIFG